MISNEEAVLQQHQQLKELMEQIWKLEVELQNAKDEERNWSRLVTQYTNELNKLKSEAYIISSNLFSEPKSKGLPVQEQ